MKIKIDPRVNLKFNNYPSNILPKMQFLRSIIIDVAEELDIPEIEETLKWREPSYLVKNGSTIRIDWKQKTPDQYAMYFKCTSKLVLTFKELFGDTFQYENNRAILFSLEQEIPTKELKICIAMALEYHSRKNIPLLGFVLGNTIIKSKSL